MVSIKKFYWLLPYAFTLAIGWLLFQLSYFLPNPFQDLFVNLSASFLAVVMLYIWYELVTQYSNRKLNKEIYDYAKFKIDNELLSILRQLIKLIYPLDSFTNSLAWITNILNLEKWELYAIIKDTEYLGFQVFKEWELSEKKLETILESNFILWKLSNTHIIAIISILKNLRALADLQKNKSDIYIKTWRKDRTYKMYKGTRGEFLERHLLCKIVDDEKIKIVDFWDIDQTYVKFCLEVFKVAEDNHKVYADHIHDLLISINKRLNFTWKEFVIDVRQFRLITNRFLNPPTY